MLINREIKKDTDAKDAVVVMGTEVNVDFLKEIGFSNPELGTATPQDLIIAIDAVDDDAAQRAIRLARDLLKKKKIQVEEMGEYRPVSLDTAFRMLPDVNLVIISLPGVFAAREAMKALEKGLHVMLFSDNVSLEDEIKLKKLARKKGILMMGPNCGTAIINGKPLCFANVVRRGNIGIVAASGTGLQEVSCIVDKLGGGISQAIGTGGRDLQSSDVGGMMTLTAIEALKHDPDTEVLVVISKPPAPDVAGLVISSLRETEKPSLVHFIGIEPSRPEGNLSFAGNLEEAARMAVALSNGAEYKPPTFTIPEEEVERLVERETSRMKGEQKYLRGLFTGGSLADEAMIVFEKGIGEVYSNNQAKPELVLKDPHASVKHTIVDLGDDVFTVGRPHPMIDPSIREERILKEVEDPEVALILLDIVLGNGCHADPAGAILESLIHAKKRAERRGGYLSIVTFITGTEGDFQNFTKQKDKLDGIGCVVMPSNFQASMIARNIMKKVAENGE